METTQIIELKESIFADNDREAEQLRQELKKKGVFLLNLMSSPGSGKLQHCCEHLNRFRMK